MKQGSDEAPLSGIRLLVVGDSETRATLRTDLHPRFDVSEAATADEALSALRARWFSAVVVDYELEDASGAALLEEVANAFPRTHRILISSRTVPNLRGMLDERIVEVFLAKPVDPQDFAAFFRSA